MKYSYCIFFILAAINFDLIGYNAEMLRSHEARVGAAEQGCRYRNSIPLPPDVFSIHASWGCYDYTREDFFLGGRLKIVACPYENYQVPGILKDGNCVPFSANSSVVQEAVLGAFQSKLATDRWLRCCNDALDCCRNTLQNDQFSEAHCPAVWDAWTCFAAVRAGITAKQVCSPYAYSSSEPRCNHYSYKECYPNATWNDVTDYSTCSITSRLITRNKWHIAMLSISVIICCPAIVVFIFHRPLRTQKYFLIILLIGSIILRDVFVILVKDIIILNELTATGISIMLRNLWSCKMLSFFEKTSANLVFTCMLLEGIFLHQLLTKVFAARRQNSASLMKYCYGIGFGSALGVSITWAIAMKVNLDENCWVVDSSHYHWINDSLRIGMLSINVVLLAHITWTLWHSFKRKQDELNPAIRTLRAAIYCIPLFGLSFVFFIVRPSTDSCRWEQFYYLVSYVMEGLQGIIVAILHFYNDREVKKILYRRLLQMFKFCKCGRLPSEESGRSSIEPRTTISTVADPRSTVPDIYNLTENYAAVAALNNVNGKLTINLNRPEFEEFRNIAATAISGGETHDVGGGGKESSRANPNVFYASQTGTENDNYVSFI